MSTISNTVETNFSFTVSNINALNKVLKTVEDIQKKSQVTLKSNASEELKLLKQHADLELKIMNYKQQGYGEAKKLAQSMQEQIKNGKTISDLEMKNLNYLAKAESYGKQTNKTYRDRMNLLDQMRDKLKSSNLSKDPKMTKELYILEKRLFDENWNHMYKKSTTLINNKIKYEKEFANLVKLNDAQEEKILQKMIKEEELANKKRLDAEQKILGLKIQQAQQTNKSITSQISSGTGKSAKASASVFSQGFTDYEKGVSNLSNSLIRHNNLQRDVVKQSQAVSTQSNRTANSIRDLSGSYMALRQAMAIKQEINQAINELKRIDETMFNLGVVAGKTGKEIDIMKYEFIDMAKNFPKSAEDIAKAVDILTRSGLDFDSSVRGIDAAIKLAVSSGEDLSSVAGIMSKALVAFKLDGDAATESVNMFHTAVLGTPLSLEGLGQGLKNSASAFSSLISFSNKSGKALENYKKELLGLNTALIGASVSMGLSASQSGTFVRGFVSRLISAEKTGVRLFNGLNLQIDGASLTFREFAKIASQDVFKALDILGKNFDKLSQNKDVLKSMFTQRQFVRVIPILKEISEQSKKTGDATREWMKTYIEGRDVAKDFETQMESLNNQTKQFDNNMISAKKSLYELIDGVGTGFMPIANKFFSWLGNTESTTRKTVLQVLELTAGFSALAIGLQAINAMGGGAFLLGAMTNPAVLMLTGVVALTSAITMGIINNRKAHEDKLEIIKKELKTTEELKDANLKLLNTLSSEYQELANGTYDINSGWNTTIDLMEKAISSSKEIQSIFTSLGTIGKLSAPSSDTNLSEMMSSIKKIQKASYMIEEPQRDLENNKRKEDILKRQREINKGIGLFSSKEDKDKAKKEIDELDAEYSKLSRLRTLNNDKLEEQIRGYKQSIEVFRNDFYKNKEEALESVKQYGVEVDLAKQNLESSHKALKEFIVSQKDMSEFKTFSEYEKFIDKYSPAMKETLKEFSDYTGDKLTLAQSNIFKTLSPIIAAKKEYKKETKEILIDKNKELKLSKEDLDNANKRLKLLKDSGKEYTAEYSSLKDYKTLNESIIKTKEVEIKTLENGLIAADEGVVLAKEMIVNAEELNEVYSKTAEYFLPKTTEELDKQNKILDTTNLSKREAIRLELEDLKAKKKTLEAQYAGYNNAIAKLNEIKSKGAYDKDTGVITFSSNKKGEVNKLQKEYATAVEKVKELAETSKGIEETQANINKLVKEEMDLVDKIIKDQYAMLEKRKDLTMKMNLIGKDDLEILKYELDVLNKTNTATMSILEKEQLSYDIAIKQLTLDEKRLSRKKELAGVLISSVDSLSTGQRSVGYNSGGVQSFLGNMMNGGYSKDTKDKKIGSDLADTFNFGLTMYDNIAGQVAEKEKTSINRKIELYEMQKSLLTDEDAIAIKEGQILSERKKLINIEAQSKARQQALGGITSGLGTMAMGGFTPGALVAGGLQMISGLFGANKAKKDAEHQKRMLDEQARNNKIQEEQVNLLRRQIELTQSILNNSNKLGIKEAIDRSLQANPLKGLSSINAITSKSNEYSKLITKFENKGFQEGMKLAGLKASLPKIRTQADHYNNRELIAEIGDSEKLRKGYFEVFNRYRDLQGELSTFTTFINKYSADFYKSSLGFSVEFLNDAGEAVTSFADIVDQNLEPTVIWEKYEDILGKIVDGTKSGIMETADYIQDYLGGSIVDAITKNDDQIRGYLNGIEGVVSNVSDKLASGMSFSDARNAITEARAYSMQIEQRQQRLNTFASLMDSGKDIEYQTQDNKITYETGTSQTINNSFYNVLNVDVASFIGMNDDSAYELADKLVPYIEQITKDTR